MALFGQFEMLTLLEEELMRRLCETPGLALVRHTSSVIAATSGAVPVGGLSEATGVSSTHLAQLRRGPAAIPARTPRPHAGRLAAASRLISYRTDSSRDGIFGGTRRKERPWAKSSCTPPCR